MPGVFPAGHCTERGVGYIDNFRERTRYFIKRKHCSEQFCRNSEKNFHHCFAHFRYFDSLKPAEKNNVISRSWHVVEPSDFDCGFLNKIECAETVGSERL